VGNLPVWKYDRKQHVGFRRGEDVAVVDRHLVPRSYWIVRAGEFGVATTDLVPGACGAQIGHLVSTRGTVILARTLQHCTFRVNMIRSGPVTLRFPHDLITSGAAHFHAI
jgi:hypothetical protein